MFDSFTATIENPTILRPVCEPWYHKQPVTVFCPIYLAPTVCLSLLVDINRFVCLALTTSTVVLSIFCFFVT